ncbi:unnamed protein product [Caenorhabditis sp. 36 PRJEB53466]|nr:unnamed protein product [Caenorhabditis sp. 36 PRJEB53466]
MKAAAAGTRPQDEKIAEEEEMPVKIEEPDSYDEGPPNEEDWSETAPVKEEDQSEEEDDSDRSIKIEEPDDY